jgi:signal transduction histidine kinase
MSDTPQTLPGSTKGHVLIVDDVPANRLLMRDLVEAQGHTVREASNGVEALEMVERSLPDVILLDIQMPFIDGLETCRRLKADPRTASVPVLLVTALGSREQRIEGIRAGANDFVTKPVDATDLMLRVGNAIALRHLYTQLQAQFRTLQRLERLRDDLVHMMIHDLRSPLSAQLSNLELLLERGILEGDDAEMLNDVAQLARRIAAMVSDVLDVSRMESGEMPLERVPVKLNAIVRNAIRAVDTTEVSVGVKTLVPPTDTVGDPAVLERVITNLVDNAVRHSPRGGRVDVVIDAGGAQATVTVSDHGPGIPAEDYDHIFEKFGRSNAPARGRRSTGLGLTFCKLAVEAHGGSIGVQSAVGEGSSFWVTLPITGKQTNVSGDPIAQDRFRTRTAGAASVTPERHEE